MIPETMTLISCDFLTGVTREGLDLMKLRFSKDMVVRGVAWTGELCRGCHEACLGFDQLP